MQADLEKSYSRRKSDEYVLTIQNRTYGVVYTLRQSSFSSLYSGEILPKNSNTVKPDKHASVLPHTCNKRMEKLLTIDIFFIMASYEISMQKRITAYISSILSKFLYL